MRALTVRRFPFEFVCVKAGFISGNHQYKRGKTDMPADGFQRVCKITAEDKALKDHGNDADDRNGNDKKLVDENIDRTAVMIAVDDKVVYKQRSEKHHGHDAQNDISASEKVIVNGKNFTVKNDIRDDVVDFIVEIPHQDCPEKPLLYVLVMFAVSSIKSRNT